MKQVVGTFFNDKEEDFKTFVTIFKVAGYEVAQQGGIRQAVVISESDEAEDTTTDETTEETTEN